jgi:Domain of unknown function (DUF4926)
MSRGSPQPASSAERRRATPRYQTPRARPAVRNVPEQGLARGDSGTIVHVFATADAYLVKFVNPADGRTRALAEFSADQLAPAGS